MSTSPTSTSAPLSNAAKDDVVGVNSVGTYTFTIADLLKNDAGSIKATTFQFGSGDIYGDPVAQAKYMSDHRGTTLDESTGIYTVAGGSAGYDFEYTVQVGNKGTYSTSDVDVKVPHLGNVLFHEGFEGYVDVLEPEWATANLSGGPNFWNEKAAPAEIVHTNDRIQSTDGSYYLDTQNTPGGINISHVFTDKTAAIDGKTAVLSFDIAKRRPAITEHGLP